MTVGANKKITRGKISWEVGLCIISHNIKHLCVHCILSNLTSLTLRKNKVKQQQ